VHLPEVAHARDARVVRDEGDAPRPREAAGKAEPPRHHGAQTVGADHQPGAAHALGAAIVQRSHAGHASGAVGLDSGDAHPLLDAGAGAARGVEQQRVEPPPSQGEPAVAEAAEAVIGGELPADARARRGAHDHPRQRRRPGRLDGGERTHVGEHPRRLRAHVLGARLVAREARAVEHHHLLAVARERPRRGCAGRPAAHHDHGSARPQRHASALETRWKSPM
jgi:hypothetical protein